MITEGKVLLRDRAVKSSHRIEEGDVFHIEIPEAAPTELLPMEMDLEILFEDSSLMVINKPAGLVVHPAAGHQNDTLVNALLHHSSDFKMNFGENRPGIVHRIDKDTSGLLVIAKNNEIQEALVQQFKSRKVHRRYQAIVASKSLPNLGAITSYLARHPSDRKRYASLRDTQNRIRRDETPALDMGPTLGKWAKTNYKLIAKNNTGLALVVLKLETGRTHQIRVHLSELNAPVVADPIYNRQSPTHPQFPRLALHAFELGFRHPITNEDLFFVRDWPEDLKPGLQALGLWRDPSEL